MKPLPDILPCVFCRMGDCSVVVKSHDLDNGWNYRVICSFCQAGGPSSIDAKNAIDYWNEPVRGEIKKAPEC